MKLIEYIKINLCYIFRLESFGMRLFVSRNSFIRWVESTLLWEFTIILLSSSVCKYVWLKMYGKCTSVQQLKYSFAQLFSHFPKQFTWSSCIFISPSFFFRMSLERNAKNSFTNEKKKFKSIFLHGKFQNVKNQ